MPVVSLPLAPVSKSAPSDAPGDLSAGAAVDCSVACDDPHCILVWSPLVSYTCTVGLL
jgi:hypothetical protein